MRKLLIGTAISLLLSSPALAEPQPSPSKVVVPATAKCGQWWQTLVDVGWKQADLPMADRIMFRESRCNAAAHNPNDPVTINKIKGSLGLFQLNLFWLQSTTSYPQGYVQSMGLDLRPKDLWDPVANARAALIVFNYSAARNGCGWSPWAMGC